MPLIIPSNSISGEYEVANSLRFDDGSSDYLNITQGSGNRKTWTYSAWIKKASTGVMNTMLSVRTNNFIMRFRDDGEDLQLYEGAGTSFQLRTNRRFRDPSAWYHIVLAVDTTQATASDRIKLYVNGVQETSFQTSNYPSQNYDTSFNNSNILDIGVLSSGSYWNGYITEIVFIDGQQLDPTSFGEFDEDTGIWKPIDVSGLTFGTNGFYLDFENSGSLGADVSGNGNNFTVNNLTSIDQSTDTPTNNYATLNPLYVGLNANFGISEGNLKGLNSGAGENNYVSNFGVSSGKWYVEAKATVSGTAYGTIGIVATDSVLQTNGSWLGSTNDSWYYSQNGHIGTNGGSTSTGHDTYTTGDIISVALNLDDNELLWYKNGAVQNSGTATSITANKTYFIGGRVYDSGTGWEFNFGNPSFTISSGNSDGNGMGNFEYAVPDGYFALCTSNLAEYG